LPELDAAGDRARDGVGRRGEVERLQGGPVPCTVEMAIHDHPCEGEVDVVVQVVGRAEVTVRLSVSATGVVVGEGPIVMAHAAPGVQRIAPRTQEEVGNVLLEPVEQRQPCFLAQTRRRGQVLVEAAAGQGECDDGLRCEVGENERDDLGWKRKGICLWWMWVCLDTQFCHRDTCPRQEAM